MTSGIENVKIGMQSLRNPQKNNKNTGQEYGIKDVVYPQQIQQFFEIEKQMNKFDELNFECDEQPSFFGSTAANYQAEVDLMLDKQQIGLFSNFQNSIFEIEQFIANFADENPLPVTPSPSKQNLTLHSQKHKDLEKREDSTSGRKEKKIKKLPNSPFHNYQKHLNNALKKLIIVSEFQPNDQLYKMAAVEIWTAYSRTQIKTKRILHFIFNQNNQHKINDPQLKNYGLWTIYHSYGKEVISQAKNYLSKLAIDQLDDKNIVGYLNTRKLKSKEGFKEYIMRFKSELESGYLKRRVTSDRPN